MLADLEASNNEAMFVFLSDVWLDRPSVTERLRRLFAGYSAFPPTAIVLAGNFLSTVGETGYAAKLKEHLKLLSEAGGGGGGEQGVGDQQEGEGGRGEGGADDKHVTPRPSH